MAIGAGALDRRIKVYRYATTPGTGEVAEGRNALNEVVRVAPPVADPEGDDPFVEVWGRREDLSDKEKLEAGAQLGALTARWVIRSTPKTRAIQGDDVLQADGATWNVVGIKESQRDGRHRYLEVTAVEAA